MTNAIGPEPRDVLVEILLNGGHRYCVTLPSDSELLRSLVSAVAMKLAGPGHGERTFFQVPIEAGRTALSFSDCDLAAITTSPPVLIESGLHVLKLNPTTSALSGQIVSQSHVVPTRWLQLDNVLKPQDVDRLCDFVLGQEAQLSPGTVTTNVDGYRKSRVLFEFPEFADLIRHWVRARLPLVLQELHMPPFDLGDIEAQLTAHNDGDFYKVHSDSGDAGTAARALTYVYYFHREPKAYTGGELLLYDARQVGEALFRADSFAVLEPRHNSIVFFPSRCEHEVLPVHCPSRSFEDSRFAVSGWVRRDE